MHSDACNLYQETLHQQIESQAEEDVWYPEIEEKYSVQKYLKYYIF